MKAGRKDDAEELMEETYEAFRWDIVIQMNDSRLACLSGRNSIDCEMLQHHNSEVPNLKL